MKKFLLLSIGCIMGITLMVSFRSNDGDIHEYITIIRHGNSYVTITESGTYKEIPPEKGPKDGTDQNQIIKLINNYEQLGYKVKQYDIQPAGLGANAGGWTYTSVILEK